eukprot:TRINITY_DN14323_c0_g1_i1.p1 TRINITY_DN14323_c0_g1~~TRINITY_DN14323_c0_g1_i1.p1  ORF type:complete len:213 (+),score=32.46 TRINITY_DN14323_c0_g1_i1:30-668(+)
MGVHVPMDAAQEGAAARSAHVLPPAALAEIEACRAESDAVAVAQSELLDRLRAVNARQQRVIDTLVAGQPPPVSTDATEEAAALRETLTTKNAIIQELLSLVRLLSRPDAPTGTSLPRPQTTAGTRDAEPTTLPAHSLAEYETLSDIALDALPLSDCSDDNSFAHNAPQTSSSTLPSNTAAAVAEGAHGDVVYTSIYDIRAHGDASDTSEAD